MHEISVVIPCYKAEQTIERAVRSVLAQPAVSAQVIVVVDGASNETLAVLSGIVDDRLSVLVNEENRGAPASRNRGLAVAAHPLVMFLDSDDYVIGNLLSGLAHSIVEGDADVAFGPWIWLDEAQNMIRRNVRRFSSATDAVEQMLLGGKFVHPSATLWRRDFLSSIGGWDQDLARFQDVELALRGILLGARTAISTIGSGVYVQHSSANRITGSRTNAESLLLAANRLLAIDSKVVPEARKRAAVGGFLYNIGRGLARGERKELGQQFIDKARDLGWTPFSAFRHSQSRELFARQQYQRLRAMLVR
ncbi:MAG: glycosyltransferase family 2 protein [Pseudomonadota bacterium]